MQKYYKLSRRERKLGESVEGRCAKLAAVALTVFLVTFLSVSVLTPVQSSVATDLLLANQATGGSVSLTTSGTVNLSMESNSAGVVRIASDEVKVTAGASGYQLYLSTVNSANALIRDGATSTGTDSSTGLPIYASSDLIPTLDNINISSPKTLDNNTWGFAILQPGSGSGSEDVVANGFDSAYATGDDSKPTSKFATIPAKGNDVKIAERSTSAANVPTTVYYGAKVTTSKPSGLYKNTIVYTAIGDSSAAGLASVTPERTNQLAGGITLDIVTPSTATLASLGEITATVIRRRLALGCMACPMGSRLRRQFARGGGGCHLVLGIIRF